MNLHDYFSSQKQVSLDASRKVAIYESVTRQTHAPVSIFARMSFYTKVALYTFVGLIFLASLYIPYFSSLLKQTDGILTTTPGGATVQADYIAQIIETKGDIEIYNNGQKVESKLFRAGDRLVLPAGAEIVFHVTTIAQAKVLGPAEFSIEKSEQGYTIQLVSGKYAEIQSLEDTTDQKEYVGFRSSRVSITPKQNTDMHFTYSEEGEKATIDNIGSAALVVAKIDNSENQEELAQHSVAALGSGTDVLTEVKAGSGGRMSPVEVAEVLRNGEKQTGGKKMISGEQHENIKAILAAEFLAGDLQRVTSAYLKGDARAYEIAYVNLYNKINQIYTLMGINIPKGLSDARASVSLKGMIDVIENLLVEMDNNFYVAQSHQARLKKLLGWLYALREKSFASYKDSEMSGSDLLGTLNLDGYKDLMGR